MLTSRANINLYDNVPTSRANHFFLCVLTHQLIFRKVPNISCVLARAHIKHFGSQSKITSEVIGSTAAHQYCAGPWYNIVEPVLHWNYLGRSKMWRFAKIND